MQTRTKSLTKLTCLLLIFIVPMIVSWLLYYFHAQIHFHTSNHGTLISPAVHDEALTLDNTSKRLWQIVYVPKACSNESLMYTLHQLRKVLGKNSNRVGLTLVSNPQCGNENVHDFRKIVLKETDHQNLAKGKIYLVDPIGNLFMSYDSHTNPMNILQDLQKVLEVSQIG